ncbi:DNA (cytosine-5)-methyltransferase 1 [Parelusimicrobium proximum]|uniref:DNA (cytosine-5-)-methyltransferase n=1 Tax=Parelusimicrobium proximum TaxID=3228953 RepID=UPI003D17DA5A
MKKSFTFIDLFAGIGGIRAGFEAAGGKCVYSCEINAPALTTYKANFSSDHCFGGDITQVKEQDIPAHDILCAGFPCQPFSIAGVSKRVSLGMPHGFMCDTQGTLFFDVARIINYHKPKIVFLENVKNLLSHDKGKTYKVIEDTLKELGYNVSKRVIDAAHFVPQHRERIFIVAERIGANINLDAVKLPAKTKKLKNILHNKKNILTSDIESGYTDNKGNVNKKYTLTDNLWKYLQDYVLKQRAKGNGFGYGLNGPDDMSRTLSARYYKDGAEILIKQARKNPRRLTPRECARLMGFADTFNIPVSDTQAYKQFGNSVVVPVIKLLAKYITEFL